MARAAMRANAATEPITTPAISPPDRPRCASSADASEVVVNSGGRVVAEGSVTSWHRVPASALAQHESVEFGELDRQ